MQQRDFGGEGTERYENGVRVRRDGQGDPWANEHRLELGHQFLMTDFDATMIQAILAQTTAENLFAEYVPDAKRNQYKAIRRFATIALFDRKANFPKLKEFTNKVTFAYYLHVCRSLALSQPIMPKFFFVIGTESPWYLQQVNIENAELATPIKCERGEWRRVWDACGLITMRERLRKWVQSEEAGL